MGWGRLSPWKKEDPIIWWGLQRDLQELIQRKVSEELHSKGLLYCLGEEEPPVALSVLMTPCFTLLKPWCCFHRAVWPLALHPWLRK